MRGLLHDMEFEQMIRDTNFDSTCRNKISYDRSNVVLSMIMVYASFESEEWSKLPNIPRHTNTLIPIHSSEPLSTASWPSYLFLDGLVESLTLLLQPSTPSPQPLPETLSSLWRFLGLLVSSRFFNYGGQLCRRVTR